MGNSGEERTPERYKKENLLDLLQTISKKFEHNEAISPLIKESLARQRDILLAAVQRDYGHDQRERFRKAIDTFDERVTQKVSGIIYKNRKELDGLSLKEKLEEPIYQHVISWLQHWIKTEYDLHFHEEFQKNEDEKPYDEILSEGLILFSKRNPDIALVWNPKRSVSGGACNWEGKFHMQ